MKTKIKRCQHSDYKAIRVLVYADGVYGISFDTMEEAQQWARANENRWHDINGHRIPTPHIDFVTEYVSRRCL